MSLVYGLLGLWQNASIQQGLEMELGLQIL